MKSRKTSSAIALTIALMASCGVTQAAHQPTSCPSGSDMKTVLRLLKTHPELYVKSLQSYRLNHNTTITGLPTSVARWMQQYRLPEENGGIHLGPVPALKFNSKLFSTTQPGVLKSITKNNVTDYYCDYTDNLYGAIAEQKRPLFALTESY